MIVSWVNNLFIGGRVEQCRQGLIMVGMATSPVDIYGVRAEEAEFFGGPSLINDVQRLYSHFRGTIPRIARMLYAVCLQMVHSSRLSTFCLFLSGPRAYFTIMWASLPPRLPSDFFNMLADGEGS